VQNQPSWLDRVLLIETDARQLPLSEKCACCVISIETLCYLNEDYELGLAECVRLLEKRGTLIVSDRDYEGGLVLRLIYHGAQGLLQSCGTRSLWDGPVDGLVRSRTFTEEELRSVIENLGLKINSVQGMPLLPLLFGWLRGRNLVQPADYEKLPAIREFLRSLALNARMRRCHIISAQREN
jgi:hypothetical protein